MKPIFDATIHGILNNRLSSLEAYLKADVVFYSGEIAHYVEKPFRDFIEDLKVDNPNRTLYIILNTPGGSAETVEKLVKYTRQHYDEVNFIVPDSAYSAGTIFCMSGDKILMDYSSSLGPIDPQIYNGANWVPALGYLDKVEELLEKSRNGSLTQAELLLLTQQDLAMLRKYEQARDLTIALIKEWLVKYKFKNWNTHRTDPVKKDLAVTDDEKEARATEIARVLGDNKRWHSHGRSIGVEVLTQELRLEIDDYSSNIELKSLIREYNDLICQYISNLGLGFFLHSRRIK